MDMIGTDQYGDNGQIWVRNAKGVTRQFKAANETTVTVIRKDGKKFPHTLQGIVAGQSVHVRHTGSNVTRIDAYQ
jgi:hypothetical protein